ncbi:MAG: aldo/keto reductase [Phycisphaeraceae bacterium]
MKQNQLGNTDIHITEVGFGAWGIGSKHYGQVAQDDARKALAAYVDGGGNFIDTARGYADSESIIGEFMKQRGNRDQLVIASKVGPTDPDKMREHLETSLSELQTDVIDLYYLHQPPDSEEDMNAALDVMEQFQAEGKIRSIGASVKGANVTDDTVDLARQYIRSGRVDALQMIFSILRQKNRAVFDEARRSGVAIIGRTVMESGFLTGKYDRDTEFPPGFPNGDHRSRWNGEHIRTIIDTADQIKSFAVKPPYETLAQVSMRFALEEPGVTSIIPGAKNEKQAKANVAIADLPPLPEDVRKRLVREYAGKEAMVNLE